jgi:hypothetical protein
LLFRLSAMSVKERADDGRPTAQTDRAFADVQSTKTGWSCGTGCAASTAARAASVLSSFRGPSWRPLHARRRGPSRHFAQVMDRTAAARLLRVAWRAVVQHRARRRSDPARRSSGRPRVRGRRRAFACTGLVFGDQSSTHEPRRAYVVLVTRPVVFGPETEEPGPGDG